VKTRKKQQLFDSGLPVDVESSPVRYGECTSVSDRRRAVKQRGRMISMSAYVLKDDGASEDFVSKKFVEKLKRKGPVDIREEGLMRVRTASANSKPRQEVRRRIKLSITIGSYTCSQRWFTIYDMDGYDIALGKRWMRDINLRHTIDHVQNTMKIWDSTDDMESGAPPHELAGLRPWEGPGRRETLRQAAAAEDMDLCFLDEEIGRSKGVKHRARKTAKLLRGAQVVQLRVALGEIEETLNEPGDLDEDLREAQAEDRRKLRERIAKEPDPRIRDLLEEFGHLFGTPRGDPPANRPVFRINTIPGSKAPWRSPYRSSRMEDVEMERQLRIALINRWIDPSFSDHAAGCLFVPKKNGKPRMVIDYRDLNNNTIKDRYPIPLLEDLIDMLSGSKVFSKLDLFSAYQQLSVAPEDRHKTAFTTKFGLYEWRVLPFGLANAPSAFMRMMDGVFARNPELKKFCVVYLDDILIHSRTEEEHTRHVRMVLERLSAEELILSLDKCDFYKNAVEFVGFWIDGDGVHTEQSKVESVRQWPTPKTAKEVMGFLGLTGFYRKFVERYAHIALPLYAASRAVRGEFEWPEECQKAFDTLKDRICTAPVLAIPTAKGDWILRTDASKEALGGVLIQRQTDDSGVAEERTIAFWSRKLTPTESRYPAYDRELLAIREAILNWRYYLHGATFTVYTDHAALQRILTQRTMSTRQITYFEVLQGYDFRIKYWPGARNAVADALSRRPDYSSPQLRSMEMTSISSADWLQEVRRSYKDDPYFGDVWRAHTMLLEGRTRKEVASAVGHLALQRTDRFTWQDGLLYYTDDLDTYPGTQSTTLCVPRGEGLRAPLFREHHDSLSSGHFGTDRTYASMRKRFYWPRMAASVKAYVKSCDTCHRVKAANGTPAGALQPLPVPNGRWTRIGIDFITKLPQSTSGMDTICTIVCHFSRRIILFPMKEETTAAEFAKLFLREYGRLHGFPARIVSDRDARFMSEFWKHYTALFGTRLSPSAPFHPQTDGATEKVNDVVGTYLKAFATKFGDTWDEALPLAEFAYNSSKHKVTTRSPFLEDLGYEPLWPMDVALAAGRDPSARALQGQAYADRLKAIMLEARDLVQAAQDRYGAADKRVESDIKEGDRVFLSTSNLPVGYANVSAESTKLRHRFAGPFDVTRKIGSNAVHLDIPRDLGIESIQNISKLKKDRTDDIPADLQPDFGQHERPRVPPPPLRMVRGGNEAVMEVHSIVDHELSGTNKKNLRYRVRYLGLSDTEDDWKSLPDLKGCRESVEEYHRRLGWDPPEWTPRAKKRKTKKEGGVAVAGESGGGVAEQARTGSGIGGGGGMSREGTGLRRSGRKRVARVREEDARMEELLSLCVCWTEMVARSVYSEA
jgi:hypothetical protein